MPTKSIPEIRQLVEKIFPDHTLRLRCLSLFAESIKHAHCHAPDKWIVRCHPQKNTKGICLLVGSRTVLKVLKEKIWIALDQKQLEENVRQAMILNKSGSWQPDKGYTTPFLTKNGYYFFYEDPSEELLPVVRKLNFAFAKRMGKSKSPLRLDSRTNYQPAVLEFLRQELKQPIPEPRTYSSLPEESDEDEVFYEGRQISVRTYERNQYAREECLKYHSSRCQVCEQYMSDIYGPTALGLIEVHHRKPFGGVDRSRPVKPKEDLIPVCPNCHAVIHRRKPPYTIEEVKVFLEKAKQDR